MRRVIFHFYFQREGAEGGGGGAARFFPCHQTTSGIGHREKYLVVFFGLATFFLPDWGMLRRSRCVLIFLHTNALNVRNVTMRVA